MGGMIRNSPLGEAQRKSNHIAHLKRIFPALKHVSADRIWQTLRHLDAECQMPKPVNDALLEQEHSKRKQASIRAKVTSFLKTGLENILIILNADGTRYTIKIDRLFVSKLPFAFEKDWEGHGLLYPKL